MSRTDRAIGIGLGLIVGIAVLIILVFGGSSQSIDAPSLNQSTGAEKPASAQK